MILLSSVMPASGRSKNFEVDHGADFTAHIDNAEHKGGVQGTGQLTQQADPRTCASGKAWSVRWRGRTRRLPAFPRPARRPWLVRQPCARAGDVPLLLVRRREASLDRGADGVDAAAISVQSVNAGGVMRSASSIEVRIRAGARR
jgi:hypothetical protein